MDLATDVGWVAGAVVVCSGVYIAVHEARRRERKVTRQEINDLVAQVDELIKEVGALQRLLLEQRRYIYKLVTLMIDAGLEPPQPPAPSFDPGEYETRRTHANSETADHRGDEPRSGTTEQGADVEPPTGAPAGEAPTEGDAATRPHTDASDPSGGSG